MWMEMGATRDLYVCSDFNWEDRFYLNDGQGAFTEVEAIVSASNEPIFHGVGFF